MPYSNGILATSTVRPAAAAEPTSGPTVTPASSTAAASTLTFGWQSDQAMHAVGHMASLARPPQGPSKLRSDSDSASAFSLPKGEAGAAGNPTRAEKQRAYMRKHCLKRKAQMQLPGNEHIRERLRANELRCRERRKAEAVAQVEMVNQLTKENRELNARLQTLEIENRILRMSADSRLASAQVASDKPPRKAGDLWNPALD